LSQLSGKPLSKDQLPAFKTKRANIEALREKSEILTPENKSETVLTVQVKDTQTP